MLAEMLEAILSWIGISLIVVLAIAGYYIAYRLLKDYREDEYMSGDMTCIYSAAALIFCATGLSLVLLLALAQEMGW